MLEQKKSGENVTVLGEKFGGAKSGKPISHTVHPNVSVIEGEKSILEASQKALAPSLYPFTGWYPTQLQGFPAGAMLKAHADVMKVEAKKGVPRTGPLMLKKTAVTEKIFRRTMGQFQVHYGQLDGWKDAVRLGISYALQDFVREVESLAGGLNNDEFAFNYADWEKLKKGVGAQVTP
ncbi:hypothetical protein CMI48_03830 [Candidatus Pacearchaeota archaeon]|nr:hypothetical protein [Candidatus Pacearchaeota archaeon]